jgi:hypothetical protein
MIPFPCNRWSSCICGNSESKGDPTGASAPRRLPDTARGKRVPEVEINVQYVQAKKTVDKLDFNRSLSTVCEVHVSELLFIYNPHEFNKR